MYVYSVLGMNLFTFVAQGDALNEHTNFETFSSSMLMLFQCITGDGWSEFMDDAMVDEERGCDPAPENGMPSDCGSTLALPYFITYMIISSFVFLNIVVAVILENFTALGNTNPDLVSANDIADFKDVWAEFDPDADGLIPTKVLPQLVMDLKAPLGLMGTKVLQCPNPRSKALRYCAALGLTQKDGKVAFKAVLDALISKNYAAKEVAIATPAGGGSPKKPASPSPSGVEVLTPRRREMAGVYAEELISGFIQRRKTEGSPVGVKRSPPPPVIDTPPPTKAKGKGKGKGKGASGRTGSPARKGTPPSRKGTPAAANGSSVAANGSLVVSANDGAAGARNGTPPAVNGSADGAPSHSGSPAARRSMGGSSGGGEGAPLRRPNGEGTPKKRLPPPRSSPNQRQSLPPMAPLPPPAGYQARRDPYLEGKELLRDHAELSV